MGGHRGLLFFFSFTLFPFVAVPVPSHVPISYFVNSTKSRMNLFRLNDKIDLGPAISSVCHRRSFGLLNLYRLLLSVPIVTVQVVTIGITPQLATSARLREAEKELLHP